MITIIDNYDSFVYNLARYFALLGQELVVVRNDSILIDDLLRDPPHAVVISPGPCTPREAGQSLEIVTRLSGVVPIFGVCLGHQVIAHAFGATIVKAERPMHGRASLIHHCGEGIFDGLPNPFLAGRYHSLIVAQCGLPDCLKVTAWTAEGTIMAIEHREHCVVGVQFHPESILTECGLELLANFLRTAGIPCANRPTVVGAEATGVLPPAEIAPHNRVVG